MILNNLNVRDDAKQERSDFARRMRLRRSPFARNPAFDLTTREIAAAESKDIQDNRITSGGQ